MKIVVKGKGLIPRGYGLAPRLTPFNADLNHIAVMLATGTFQIETVDPDTNKPVIVTKQNVMKLYRRHEEVKKNGTKKEVTPVQDKVVDEEVKVEIPKVEEIKPIVTEIKPIVVEEAKAEIPTKLADNDILIPIDTESPTENPSDNWKKKNRK
jgi:hypothetical protein